MWASAEDYASEDSYVMLQWRWERFKEASNEAIKMAILLCLPVTLGKTE